MTPDRSTSRPSLRQRWAALSLAARVTAAATALVGATLAVSAVLLVATLRIGLLDSLDAVAAQRAADLVELVSEGAVPPIIPQVADLTQAQVIGPDGSVVSRTSDLDGEPPLVGPRAETTNGADEGDVRLLVRPAGPYTVVVATPLEEVQEVTTRLSVALSIGVPVLLAVLAWLVRALVRYALRTVDRLRREVAGITATDLHRRVDAPPARDEVRALALTMNELLARLEASSDAQRRFVADAAHELRSPLAALHAQLEVGQRRGDPTAWVESAPRMLADTARLARLVEDLLALARLDERSRPQRADLVDLDEVVFTQVAQLRPVSRVPLRTAQVSAGLVRGDEDMLTRVVRNLLDNANRHAASQVEVALRTLDDVVELVVADDGPGIPAVDRDRVFRRFERLDAARDRDSGGSGLGLAIVHHAVATHGGTVQVEPSAAGARVVVRLPVAAAEAVDGRLAGSPSPAHDHGRR